MPPRPRTWYACGEVVFHSNVKVFLCKPKFKECQSFSKRYTCHLYPYQEETKENIRGWCDLKVSRCTIYENALGKLVSNDNGNLSIVRCKMCTKIECKCKMLVPKWDSF